MCLVVIVVVVLKKSFKRACFFFTDREMGKMKFCGRFTGLSKWDDVIKKFKYWGNEDGKLL